ncbi:glutamyl-tRNA reductase [Pantoea sp. Aalb]|nr:glutamyl-tRNA reductase [Pantoea sp. Aalb]
MKFYNIFIFYILYFIFYILYFIFKLYMIIIFFIYIAKVNTN